MNVLSIFRFFFLLNCILLEESRWAVLKQGELYERKSCKLFIFIDDIIGFINLQNKNLLKYVYYR